MWRKTSQFILFFATALLWLDVFTFQGYLSSFIHIPSKIIMLFILFVGAVVVAAQPPLPKSSAHKLLFTGAALTIIYAIIIAVEGGTNQGFVFAHLHMRPESMFVAILGTLWAITAISSTKLWIYMTCVALSFYFARLVPIVVTQSYVTTREVVRSPFASRDDKMKLNWGGFYDFAQFVNGRTPNTASIGIPPRSNTHPLIGNSSFFWYFAYPRTLVSLPLEVTDLTGVDYIVIDGGDSIWPDIKVRAKHVWYYRDGGPVTELKNTTFDSLDSRYYHVMGLIELEGDTP